MYVSQEQLSGALPKLRALHVFYGFALLAFKKAMLPVGAATDINFTSVMAAHLDRYFRPLPSTERYYNPFGSSRPDQRWIASRYPSTSLQRIVADTFGECFIHTKGTSVWGWQDDYLQLLVRRLGKKKIPAAPLATWMFRDEDLGDKPKIEDLLGTLRKRFYLNDEIWSSLFDENVRSPDDKFADAPLTTHQIEALLGVPPGEELKREALLGELQVNGVGPILSAAYRPGKRVNVITGDNSVGKTFLLDSIWWALTGTWAGDQLTPPVKLGRNNASIEARLRFPDDAERSVQSSYEWAKRKWVTKGRVGSSSLAIFARHDGSIAVWDPMVGSEDIDSVRKVRLTSDEVRHGKIDSELRITLCNGLYRDWVSWQLNPSRYRAQWSAFCMALKALSPADIELEAGDPIKLPPNEQEMPTLRMPYGDTLLSQSSAATARVLSLAYVLVWSWFRHVDAATDRGIEPSRNVAVLVDELEAHLHPKWQRTVLPSLVVTVNSLASFASIQLHIATHSPLVLASLEPIFDDDSDALFKMDFDGPYVSLDEIPFNREGRIDRWLTSNVFGLTDARSIESEEALQAAKQLLLSRDPVAADIASTHSKLLKLLPSDDEFWPRWLPFAVANGVVDDPSTPAVAS